ncbi:hypothetical protein C3941_23730 [Kaistia algarum]|uniref:low affinity iron permease family protein n=1 Tax=Kaistia algarum TaxID=2083279 RepID=UPI000CE82BE4|nr:low affinity iron permease family protein [Kaistia algarum]MCX5513403.1 low affinity iron permease family protein [Kaistia algarum]PPE77409.1 hypothetical protein C3941_23730 [Kaistia algarum]
MNRLFSKFANFVSRTAGTPAAFFGAVGLVVLWAVTGPLFGFSETWQLVINTGTTIITFLMVFVIQNSQNRDGSALQTKLDELIRASAAGNEFMGIEKLSDAELERLHTQCVRAAESANAILDRTHKERAERGLPRAP